MKKSLLLAGLIAVATGFSAYADNENVVNIPWQLACVHNAETDQFVYPYEEEINSVNNIDRVQIKLVKPDAMDSQDWTTLVTNYVLDTEMVSEVSISTGEDVFTASSLSKGYAYIYVNVEFSEPVTQTGVYNINLPEGLVKFQNGSVSKQTTIENAFTVKSEWQPSFASYILDPQAGTTVKSLKQIRITFPNAVDLMDDDMTVVFNSELYSPRNVTLSIGQSEDPYCYADDVEMIDAFSALITFDSNLDNGEYTLTIPGGMFYCSAKESATNSGIVATYTLEQSLVSLNDYSFTPEPRVSQQSIDVITLAFKYVFKIKEIYVDALETEDFSIFNLINENGKAFDCTGVEPGDDEKSLVINFDEITEDGSYTMTLPAGLFVTDVPGEPEVDSPAITATFVVGSGTYVASVFEGEESINAVDLAGRTVLRGSNAAAVSSLEPGIYVINGKKVIIRK